MLNLTELLYEIAEILVIAFVPLTKLLNLISEYGVVVKHPMTECVPCVVQVEVAAPHKKRHCLKEINQSPDLIWTFDSFKPLFGNAPSPCSHGFAVKFLVELYKMPDLLNLS